jgi:hypothetical protein
MVTNTSAEIEFAKLLDSTSSLMLGEHCVSLSKMPPSPFCFNRAVNMKYTSVLIQLA